MCEGKVGRKSYGRGRPQKCGAGTETGSEGGHGDGDGRMQAARTGACCALHAGSMDEIRGDGGKMEISVA